MEKKLNYRKLLKQWMKVYTLPVERSKKMFSAIWTRLQMTLGISGEEGADGQEEHVE